VHTLQLTSVAVRRAVLRVKVDGDVWRDDNRSARHGRFRHRSWKARVDIVRCRTSSDEFVGHMVSRLRRLERTIHPTIQGRCPSYESGVSGSRCSTHLRRTPSRDERRDDVIPQVSLSVFPMWGVLRKDCFGLGNPEIPNSPILSLYLYKVSENENREFTKS
jgi:hypothetical protein